MPCLRRRLRRIWRAMLNTLRHMSGMGVLARAQQSHNTRDSLAGRSTGHAHEHPGMMFCDF
jgi:hypothetical protein